MTRGRLESDSWLLGTLPGPWVRHAICGTHPLEWWFPSKANPVGRGAPGRRRSHERGVWARARAVCEKCPVIADCLAHALEHEADNGGMWGGKTQAERQLLRSTT